MDNCRLSHFSAKRYEYNDLENYISIKVLQYLVNEENTLKFARTLLINS